MAASVIPLSAYVAQRRDSPPRGAQTHVRGANGALYGGNYKIPEGDFARFLGWKKPTREEVSGRAKVSGARALEVAVHEQMAKLGEQAMERGMGYRNMYVSWGKFTQEPGREKDMIASGLDAIQESVELGHAMGIRYLEMQYKFQMASKNFGTISNLMKTRNEAVKKSISEVR